MNRLTICKRKEHNIAGCSLLDYRVGGEVTNEAAVHRWFY